MLLAYVYTTLRVLLEKWDHIMPIFLNYAFFTHQILDICKFYLCLAHLVTSQGEKGWMRPGARLTGLR